MASTTTTTLSEGALRVVSSDPLTPDGLGRDGYIDCQRCGAHVLLSETDASGALTGVEWQLHYFMEHQGRVAFGFPYFSWCADHDYTHRLCPVCGEHVDVSQEPEGGWPEGDPTKTVADYDHWISAHPAEALADLEGSR